MARFEIPPGSTAQAYKFALDPTPAQVRAFRSHAGAARKAHNTMLAAVKAVLDQRTAERSYGLAEDELTPSLGWSLPALRKAWNARKEDLAPWWRENSKEAYNTGLDALARGIGRMVDVPHGSAGREDGRVPEVQDGPVAAIGAIHHRHDPGRDRPASRHPPQDRAGHDP